MSRRPAPSAAPAAAPDSVVGADAGLAALGLSYATDWLALSGGIALSGQLNLGSLDVAGTLALTGAARVTAGDATLGAGTLLAQGAGASLLVTGTLALAGTASALAGGAIQAASVALLGGELACDGAGTLQVGIPALANPGTLTVGFTGRLSGHGRLGSPLRANGVVTASDGALALFGAVAGQGTLAIAPLATLFAAGGVGADITIAFLGAGGTLDLFGPAAFAGGPGAGGAGAVRASIVGFSAGSVIDIASASIVAARWAAGVLSLRAASGAVLALDLPGDFAGAAFVPMPDGLGGTAVQIAAAAQPLPPGSTVLLEGGLRQVAGGQVSGQFGVDGTVAVAGAVAVGALSLLGTLAVLGGGVVSAGSASVLGLLLGQDTASLEVAGLTSVSGTLSLVGGAGARLGTLSLAGGALSLDPSSSLAIGSAAVARAGAVALGAGATVNGFGRIAAAIDVQGTLRAQAGLLVLGGAVGGAGKLFVGLNATLSTYGAVSLPVRFAPGGRLDIAAPAQFTGKLTAFAPGNTLDVAGVPADAASWAPGTLSLLAGGVALATLPIAGAYAGQAWQCAPDGQGGVLVQLSSVVAPPLVVSGSLSVATLLSVPSAAVLAAGTLAMEGGTLIAGGLAVAASALLSGHGSLAGPVVANGTLLASGGALSVGGRVSGGGVARIGPAARLFAADRLDVPVAFAGAGGTLGLYSGALGSGVISGLDASDAIVIAGASVTSARYVATGPGLGALALSGPAGALGTLTLAGDLGGHAFVAWPDGAGSSVIALVPCFAAGTRIATPDGECPVEGLRPGDMALTPSGPRVLQWVGRRDGDARRARELRPVRIAAGALGPSLPRRDLWLSPRHAVLLDGLLIPAVALVGLPGVERAPPGPVRYHHVALAGHGIVLAEGWPVETFRPVEGAEAVSFDHAEGRLPPPGPPCAPLLDCGPALDALRRRWRAPAALSLPGALQGHVERRAWLRDGGSRLEGWALDAADPSRPVALQARRDGAACGVTLANLWRPDLDRAGLGDGGCGFVLDLPGTPDGVTLHRLADGAALPAAA